MSKDLALNTSDGVIIRGWHVQAQKPERILIYFHENAGSTHSLKQTLEPGFST
jgi:hypothetical protein